MPQNIYPIQLLNDIHNYFPDILYNPSRFRNVQDLLEYIRRVADVNPYTAGLEMYNSLQRGNGEREQGNNTERTIPSLSEDFLRTNINSIIPPNSTLLGMSLRRNIIPYTIRTTIVSNGNVEDISGNNINSAEISSVLSQLIATILGENSTISENNLQNFLEQRVIVTPSAAQIESATQIERMSGTQEEICTICQDQINEGEEIRKIIHCRHNFHKECIDVWFNRNVHCPTCRYDIRDSTS